VLAAILSPPVVPGSRTLIENDLHAAALSKPVCAHAAIWILTAALACGCAHGPYEYGRFANSGASQVTIRHGQPNKTLDRMSDIVSWPGRKLFPDRPDRRNVTPETLAQVERYLEKNDLADVQVSVRDYQPGEQWRRLHQQKVVPPLSRYTLGSLSVLRYTLLPGRVFGRNAYNPYTNTLYVNSDTPAMLLHSAAYAKNIRRRPLPGFYATAASLLLVSAWHEVEGVREVIGYAQAENDWALEVASYEEVYPRVGAASVGGASAIVSVWWGGPLLGVAGAAVGGMAGHRALERREAERSQEINQLVEQQVTGRVQQASHAEPADRPSRRRYVTPSAHQE
jgi:hypothetical protein